MLDIAVEALYQVRMRLDTSRRQAAAIALCESLGFRNVAAYYDIPAELGDRLLFFECDL